MKTRWSTSPPKPKRRFANGVLWFGFVFLTLFTIVITVGFFVTQTEPSTLIGAVYGFWGAECVGLLVKRITDKKNGGNTE